MPRTFRMLRLLATAAALATVPAALHAQTTPPAPPAGGGTGSSAMGAMGGQDSAGAMARRGGMHRSGQVDSTLVSQLDSVNTAAQAGLTTLPPSAAAALVGSIQGKLSGSRNPALRSIAGDLSQLQTELSAGTVNGARVGALLRRLGPKVTRVAATQSGAVATTLQSIGSQLSAAGRQLTGGRAGAAVPAGTR